MLGFPKCLSLEIARLPLQRFNEANKLYAIRVLVHSKITASYLETHHFVHENVQRVFWLYVLSYIS